MINSNIIHINDLLSKSKCVQIYNTIYKFHGSENYLFIAENIDRMIKGIINREISKQERLKLVVELRVLLLYCLNDDNLKGLTVIFSDKLTKDKLGFDGRYVYDFMCAMKL